MAAPVRLCKEPLQFLVFKQMSQFRSFGKWVQKLCLPEITFLSGSEADSREELAGASLYAGTLSSTRLSVNYSNHSGRSRDKSWLGVIIYACFFQFLLVLATSPPRAWLLVFSLRVVSGRNVETTESCCNDAGDVGEAELEDRPGTTIGT